jgi:RHS repeat-associated protein
MTSMSIPGDTTYSYTYDAMSNLVGMSAAYFSTTATYNWAGQRLTGPDGTRTYNNLLQLTRIQNGNLDDQYIYQAGQNNGRIVQLIDNLRGETVNYSYDQLNRLTSAQEAHGWWGNAFSYDGWGNINGQTWTPGQAATPGTQWTPGGDANGNSGGTFDVENRLVTPNGAPTTVYSYDPWNKRIEVCCPMDQYNNQYNQYTFYGIDGRPLTTFGAIGNADGSSISWTIGTNLYFGGSLIRSNGNGVSVDRLGSVRSNGSGAIAYYPYGMERTSTPDGTNKFGTYFRDGNWAGLGQDYADQRYYNANYGAFWSPDPGGLKGADAKNPGSWNRYAYAYDDPINFADPTGMGACSVELKPGDRRNVSALRGSHRSKLNISCRLSSAFAGGRLPFCGARRRRRFLSNPLMNSSAPCGRPVCVVARMISVSSSVPSPHKYSPHAEALHAASHSPRSRSSGQGPQQ